MTRMQACVCRCVHVRVRTRTHACTRACVRVYVCRCMCLHMRAHVCLLTCPLTYQKSGSTSSCPGARQPLHRDDPQTAHPTRQPPPHQTEHLNVTYIWYRAVAPKERMSVSNAVAMGGGNVWHRWWCCCMHRAHPAPVLLPTQLLMLLPCSCSSCFPPALSFPRVHPPARLCGGPPQCVPNCARPANQQGTDCVDRGRQSLHNISATPSFPQVLRLASRRCRVTPHVRCKARGYPC